MPLMKGRSKKAFSHNVEAEMHAGKPQDQSLAIAYSVKRKSKKKMNSGGAVQSGSPDMNYAEGGSVKSEKRPMPDDRHNDAKMVSRNSGDKAPKNDQWTDNPTVKQAQNNSSRKVLPIKHPKMVPQNSYSVRLRDEEDSLQSSASPGPYDAQPPKHDDEEGPNRQGPKVSDMADEHSTKAKPYRKEIEDQYAQDVADADMKRSNAYAKGGMVEESDYSHPENKYEHDFKSDTPSEDEGASYARSRNEEGPDRSGPGISDNEEPHSENDRQYDDAMDYDREMELNPAHDKHSADDSEDQPKEEADMDHEDSIAAAIMSKKDRKAMQHSDSDIDSEMMMALGGEILHDADEPLSHGSMDSDDSDQADLSRNAEEDANEEDQASFDALRKENYSESEGLRQLDNPKDSGQHGDSEESDSENEHDKIDKMRSRMNMRRQFKQR